MNTPGLKNKGMLHYWHDGADQTAFVSLLNQSGAEQTLPLHSIQFRGESLPKYEPILVPLAQDTRSFYAQIMNFNLPISQDYRLAYATSEILTVRPFNQDQLLIIYGPPQSSGEMKINGEGLRFVYADPGFQIKEHSDKAVIVTYPHVHGQMLILENIRGQRLRIVSSDNTSAGFFWFLQQRGSDLVMAGPDFVEAEVDSFRLDFDDRPGQVWVMSAEPLHDMNSLEPMQTFHTASGISRFGRPRLAPWPALPELQNIRLQSDRAETHPDYDTSSWINWSGEPQSLESLGIYQGHAWYRSTFEVPDLKQLKDDRLYVESASDIVGIYINDHYVTTVAPVGTEINNKSRAPDYRFASVKPYLHKGRNVISFRTEIWGHGSFMWGRGHLPFPFVKARLPALGYKGLMGPSRIAGIPLEDWQLRPGLSGETAGFADPGYDDSDWTPGPKILQLNKGDVLWLRAQFDTDAIPDRQNFDAPIVLKLKGISSKATIFVNGQLLGRWLSDAGWLKQGSWIRPQVGMWVSADPNDLPIPNSLLVPGGRNQLAIVFEDTSRDINQTGVINTLQFSYNREGLRWIQAGWKVVPGLRQRVSVKP